MMSDGTKIEWPNHEGHWWAKWRIATDETCEGDELTPSDKWEVVQVNDNNGAVGTLEEFSVSVPGVREVQWRDGFIWGPKVTLPVKEAGRLLDGVEHSAMPEGR